MDYLAGAVIVAEIEEEDDAKDDEVQ